MKSIPFPQVLTFISLLVLLVLATDTFVLPLYHIQEVYDRGYSMDIAAGGSRFNYRTAPAYYILTVAGDKLRIPDQSQNVNLNLAGNDTFYLDRSRLLHQPIVLEYPVSSGNGKGKDFAPMPLGLLNTGWYGPLTSFFILFAALAQFLPFISPSRRETLAYVSLFAAVFIGINYFWH